MTDVVIPAAPSAGGQRYPSVSRDVSRKEVEIGLEKVIRTAGAKVSRSGMKRKKSADLPLCRPSAECGTYQLGD
jgi:hypothetical protein